MSQNRTTPPPHAEAETREKAARTGDEQQQANANEPGALEDARITSALHAASEKKALDTVVLDLRQVATFTDFFLITSGTNVRQVQAVADEVVERLKRQGARPARVEGYNTGEWVLVDYGDFIVHVFEDKARRFYDLERLWRDAARVELPAELRGTPREEAAGGGSLRKER